ncbi:YncE family protein [Bacillus toyonensis]|uniref:YncE family protein n=1 Tax=Bacillus toyonensis TaxID=155322 RepID=UPI0027154F5A|nr:YncE family protein [Bacillus toyonensis]
MSNLILDLQKFLRRYISVNLVSGAIVEGLLTQINTSNATAVINSEYGINEVAIDQIISYIILPYIYVANQDSNNVTVIDPATNAVLTTIPVDSGPFDVAITPNGQTAYVSNFFSNSISVINISNNTLSATISPGNDHPLGIAITPDGTKVYIATAGPFVVDGSAITVINTAINTVIAKIQVPGQLSPEDIAVTPNGLQAYFTVGSNSVGGHVRVLDTTKNVLIGSPITAGSNTYGIAITPITF